ncbi:MAG TPA: hypothetical protein VFV33_05145 [Gemmatimonadaceae bacterium]|nr:hypothetical protein [Gemmatimonadaceae bacterium]
MRKQYAAPHVVDHGHIADCTFQTPGRGTKSSNTSYALDKFGEYSHPAGGGGGSGSGS